MFGNRTLTEKDTALADLFYDPFFSPVYTGGKNSIKPERVGIKLLTFYVLRDKIVIVSVRDRGIFIAVY